MLNITQFKARIEPKLHGTTLAKLSGFFDRMHEGSGIFLSHVKPYSVIRRARIANAIYDKVYNYSCQDDLEVDSIIDIRPIGTRSTRDDIDGTLYKEFDIKKENNTCEIEFINGVKTLRLSKQLTARTVLFEADSLTLGATVTAGGDVTDLAIDDLDYISGFGSIGFNLSGSTGQGTLDFALTSSVDISTLEDLGAVFNYFKFPLASALTSLRIRIGSDSSNYKEVTVTAAHDRAFEDDAYMLIRYLLSNGTTTGTPDFDAIDYIQLAVNYTAGTARNGVRVDNFTASLGQAWEVVYYSNRMFTDATGTTWKEIPTLDTDLIRLDGSTALTAYIYETMLAIIQDLKGKNAVADTRFYMTQLGVPENNDGKLYDVLQRQYPNQALIRSQTYYEFGNLSD